MVPELVESGADIHSHHSRLLGRRENSLTSGIYGAGEWIRTTDLLITNQLLCQLSYPGPEDEGAKYKARLD